MTLLISENADPPGGRLLEKGCLVRLFGRCCRLSDKSVLRSDDTLEAHPQLLLPLVGCVPRCHDNGDNLCGVLPNSR